MAFDGSGGIIRDRPDEQPQGRPGRFGERRRNRKVRDNVAHFGPGQFPGFGGGGSPRPMQPFSGYGKPTIPEEPMQDGMERQPLRQIGGAEMLDGIRPMPMRPSTGPEFGGGIQELMGDLQRKPLLPDTGRPGGYGELPGRIAGGLDMQNARPMPRGGGIMHHRGRPGMHLRQMMARGGGR